MGNGLQLLSMSEHISVVTANTHMAEALYDQVSMDYFAQHDVVMLQEAIVPESHLAKLFHDTGLSPIIASEGMGLAILARYDMAVQSLRKTVLHKPGRPFANTATIDPESNGNVRFRARGMLAAKIELFSGIELTVATAHPTVPLKTHARKKQILALAQSLPHHSEKLVLGGDMNHWPSPRKIDRQFRTRTRLIDAIEDRTFDVSKTRYAKLGHLARLGIPVNGQLDALLYRGSMYPAHVSVNEIASDHRAISATFQIDH